MLGARLLLAACVVLLHQTRADNSKAPTLRLMVVGVTGSGKSTLVNTVLGKEVADVGDSIDSVTSQVKVHKRMIGGVDVRVCDTPGLQDSKGNEKENLQTMKTECRDPDLVIYCQNVMDRWRDDHQETISIITEEFGSGFWKRAVVALTHADRLHSKDSGYGARKLQEWTTHFRNKLLKINVPEEIVREVSFNLTTKSRRERVLGFKHFWITYFYRSCLKQCAESGRNGLLAIMNDVFEAENIPVPEQMNDLLCGLIGSHPTAYTGVGVFLGTKLGASFGGLLGPLGALFGGAAGYGVSYLASKLTCPTDPNQAPSSSPSDTRDSRGQKDSL